jgi:hypothetical protein
VPECSTVTLTMHLRCQLARIARVSVVFGDANALQHAKADMAIGEPKAYLRFHRNVSCTIGGCTGERPSFASPTLAYSPKRRRRGEQNAGAAVRYQYVSMSPDSQTDRFGNQM